MTYQWKKRKTLKEKWSGLSDAMQVAVLICVVFIGWQVVSKMVAYAEYYYAMKQIEAATEQMQRTLANMPKPRAPGLPYAIVTERVEPRSLQECQRKYGAEINETIRHCMEGGIYTFRVDSKTKEKRLMRRQKLRAIENQNVL